MDRGRYIVALGSDEGDAEFATLRPDETAPRAETADVEATPVVTDAFPPERDASRAGTLLVAALLLGWSGFFLWAHQPDFARGGDPRLWTALASQWAIPPLLIGVVWLLAMRNSRRESGRFARTARMLNAESARLETRLTAVNRELSLAREFIAAQARDLDTLGRLATERLGECSGRLQELVQVNSERIDSIGQVSQVALDNMERLRSHLPVLANSTKDMTNYIGSAGRTAQEHVRELHEALHRLGDAGVASEQQVRSLRQAVDAAMADFDQRSDQLAEMTEGRFAALTRRGEAFRTQLDAHEAQALAAVRNRAGALAEELEDARSRLEQSEQAMLLALHERITALRDEAERIGKAIQQQQADALQSWRNTSERVQDDIGSAFVLIDNADRDAFDASHKRLVALSDEVGRIDSELREREQAFLGQGEALAHHGETIAARLAECERRIAEIATHGAEAGSTLTASLQALESALSESRAALAGSDAEVARLVEGSERVLELLRASSAHGRGELVEALAAGEHKASAVAAEIDRILGALEEARRQSDSLAQLLDGAGGGLVSNLGEVARLQAAAGERAADHAGHLEALRLALGEIESANDRLLGKLREDFGTVLSGLSHQLSEASSTALDRAMRTSTAETAGKLEQAAAHALGVGSEAARLLRGEVARVEELTAQMEGRIADALKRAEEHADHGFAARAAQIGERLEASAIEIGKALSRDVPDTAWKAYLRGDRGIFSRRAVRLLDSGESHSIAALYESDADFRENVSRYIRDFETMLRQLLTTQQGDSFAVTLLSSDMGKLYIALAQATERLRR